MVLSKFEHLSNEIILDVLDLLDGIDVYRAINGLNHRFDLILLNHRYHINLVNMRNATLNYALHVLSSISNRVISLSLSRHRLHDEYELSCSHIFLLPNFERLEHLSLGSNLHPDEWDQIITQFSNFPALLSLKLDGISWPKSKARCLLDICLSTAPNLQSLTLRTKHYALQPTSMFSHSRCKTLTVQNININDLEAVCHRVLNLEKLSVTELFYRSSLFPIQSAVNWHSLRELYVDITLSHSNAWKKLHLNRLAHFLTHMNQLEKFSLNNFESTDEYLNGCAWEQIIRCSLQKLTHFKLALIVKQNAGEVKRMDVQHIIEAYRNDFWLIEKKWFASGLLVDDGRCLHFGVSRSIRFISFENSCEQIDPVFVTTIPSNLAFVVDHI